jgi:hypothetical protein
MVASSLGRRDGVRGSMPAATGDAHRGGRAATRVQRVADSAAPGPATRPASRAREHRRTAAGMS